MTTKKVYIYLLSSPFFVLGVVFDLIKLPALLFFVLPIVGLIATIDRLRTGKDQHLLEFAIFFATTGTCMWMEMVGLHPKWSDYR